MLSYYDHWAIVSLWECIVCVNINMYWNWHTTYLWNSLGHWMLIHGCVYMRTNHVPKDVSDCDPKRDWDRDLNYVHSHALQTPFQSRSGSAHCEVIFAPTAHSALIDPCMASARISKMHTHDSRSERALCSHVLESGFLRESRSKTPFFSRFKMHNFESLI